MKAKKVISLGLAAVMTMSVPTAEFASTDQKMSFSEGGGTR